MRGVLSIFFWIAGGALTVLLWLAVFLSTILFYPFDRKRKIGHFFCYLWADALIGMNPFWKLEVSGLENIDKRKTYVMIANHQSLADIIVIYRIHAQFKWVAKESLFKLPFLGWNLSLIRHIRITRGKFGSIKKVYKDAAKWLRSGTSVLFFPEGTRSETGRMREFQNGAFKLAIKEKKEVLPISISGTRAAIPKGNWIFKGRVSGRLKVLPPLEVSSYKPAEFELLRDRVRSMLEEAAQTS